MSKHLDLFLDAKRIIRAHPEWDDVKLAEELGVHAADKRAMDTIATARRDVAADKVT